MAEVWDENWYGSTKTLDVTIGRLRKKLEGVRVDERVVAVRGVGFRLEGAGPCVSDSLSPSSPWRSPLSSSPVGCGSYALDNLLREEDPRAPRRAGAGGRGGPRRAGGGRRADHRADRRRRVLDNEGADRVHAGRRRADAALRRTATTRATAPTTYGPARSRSTAAWSRVRTGPDAGRRLLADDLWSLLMLVALVALLAGLAGWWLAVRLSEPFTAAGRSPPRRSAAAASTSRCPTPGARGAGDRAARCRPAPPSWRPGSPASASSPSTPPTCCAPR